MQRTLETYGSDSDLAGLKDVQSPKGRRANPITRQLLKRPRGGDEWQEDFKTFKDEILKGIQCLKTDMNSKLDRMEKSLEKTSLDIEKSIEFLAQKYEAISEKQSLFEATLRGQQEHILTLENKIEELSRQAQSSHIEIRNVPLKEKETKKDLQGYIRNLSKTLNVEGLEVHDAYRWASKKDGKQTIVAELNNSASKYDLLKAAKAHNMNHPTNRLSCHHLGLTDLSGPIFVGEHLTSKARRLYFLGRELQKSRSYRFCWTANGRIYVRKAEGSPMILLKDEDQVQSLLNTD